MTPATPATPVPCAPSASSGLLHRRGWLAGVLALTVAALPGVALARPRRRPVRRRKRRGLTAAQRGSGRVQRIDASLPDPIAGELPGIESKGGFTRPSFAERRLQRR